MAKRYAAPRFWNLLMGIGASIKYTRCIFYKGHCKIFHVLKLTKRSSDTDPDPQIQSNFFKWIQSTTLSMVYKGHRGIERKPVP